MSVAECRLAPTCLKTVVAVLHEHGALVDGNDNLLRCTAVETSELVRSLRDVVGS